MDNNRKSLAVITVHAIALVTLLCCSPHSTGEEARPERQLAADADGRIAGRVLMHGRRVEGARVVIELHDWENDDEPPPQSSKWETITDTEGRFQFEHLPRTSPHRWNVPYVILATKDTMTAYSKEHLTGDIDFQFKWLELMPTGSISGHVTDEQGDPVEGAGVFPDQRQGVRHAFGGSIRFTHSVATTLRARTDSKGHFEVQHLPAGKWNLTAWSKEHALTKSGPIPQGSRDARLVMPRGGDISGQVVSRKQGQPVPGVEVNVRCNDSWRKGRTSTTDAAGRFAVHAVAGGMCVATIDDPVWFVNRRMPPFLLAAGGEIDNLKATVDSGAVVAGRIYNVDSGEAVAGVRIRATGQQPGLPRREALSDTNGHYTLQGLGPGRYALARRWKLGYLHGETRESRVLTLKPGDKILGVDFPIQYGFSLSGQVLDEQGNPIERVRVDSKELSDQGEGEVTETPDDGRFVHRGFSPNGCTKITVAHRDFYTRFVGPIEIGEEDQAGIEIVMERRE